MIRPGDSVFVESPTYDRAITIFRRHNAEVSGIPLQPDGPDIEALESALRKRVPKFFYTIPDFQNPAGVTCSERKEAANCRTGRAIRFHPARRCALSSAALSRQR
jgi:DNA-binding transcriptional MocR family regulator